MTKRIGARVLNSGDVPIRFLYEQGVRWEDLRERYWESRDVRKSLEAAQNAAFYEAAWRALPNTAHLSRIPTPKRVFR